MEVKNIHSPNIIEETRLNGNIISIFDRLVLDRKIYVSGPVTQTMADVVNAQIMYLDSVDSAPIELILDSPGGSVRAGLTIVDAMNLSKCEIHVQGVGMAASMGSVLISNGEKGHRLITKYSEVMIHQSSGGTQGNIQDANISHKHWIRYNEILFDIIAKNVGKAYEEVLKDAERDFWLNSLEALEYGIVDGVIWNSELTITRENVDSKEVLDVIKDDFIYKHWKGIKVSDMEINLDK